MDRKSPLQVRLENRMQRRELLDAQHQSLLEERGEQPLGETDKQQIGLLRGEISEIDQEVTELLSDIEARKVADDQAKLVRRAELNAGGVEEDGVVYRSMAEYARDVILTRESTVCSQIAAQFGGDEIVKGADARLELLKRVPANTLSSNVGGLQPPQHIDQIFQVIQTARPIVASASRAALMRGTLTYPQVSQKPVVAVQNTEKTEAGNQAMHVDMETTTASTYLGGGDLSWQAINWSTPDALQLWFDLAADSYALLTEEDAAQVIIDAGQAHVVSDTFDATADDFAALLKAIGEGASAVYANSGRVANTVYMSVDSYWYIFGLTSAAFAQFANVSDTKIGPLNFVSSRGLDAATVVVGDSSALLVAETDGAPVELRVVEPAIGGVEVGIIGAFEAVVVDPGSFSLVSAAS